MPTVSDADPDSPDSDLYGSRAGAGYLGGVGGGPEIGNTALQSSLGTLAGLGFGSVARLSLLP